MNAVVLKLSGSALLLAALAGCASMNSVDSEVSTFGAWPGGRTPGRYVIERLPSQQAVPPTPGLEAAGRAALERAGFRPADSEAQADVSVELTTRVSRVDPYPYYGDPFGRVGFGYGWGGWGRRSSIGLGVGFPLHANPHYDREVGVVIRDRSSGRALYEAKAQNSGGSPGDDRLLGAMFDAALAGFPNAQPQPRRVTVPLATTAAHNAPLTPLPAGTPAGTPVGTPIAPPTPVAR